MRIRASSHNKKAKAAPPSFLADVRPRAPTDTQHGLTAAGQHISAGRKTRRYTACSCRQRGAFAEKHAAVYKKLKVRERKQRRYNSHPVTARGCHTAPPVKQRSEKQRQRRNEPANKERSFPPEAESHQQRGPSSAARPPRTRRATAAPRLGPALLQQRRHLAMALQRFAGRARSSFGSPLAEVTRHARGSPPSRRAGPSGAPRTQRRAQAAGAR